MKNFKVIVAVAENGVIGNGLQIPWHISEDFKHFKATTMGGVIVMGRRTWESLGGRPLAGRENVVLTSGGKEFAGATVVGGIDELIKKFAQDTRTIWICGGANIYTQLLPLCDEIILSRIKLNPDGDVFFPDITKDFIPVEKILESEKFDVIKYARK